MEGDNSMQFTHPFCYIEAPDHQQEDGFNLYDDENSQIEFNEYMTMNPPQSIEEQEFIQEGPEDYTLQEINRPQPGTNPGRYTPRFRPPPVPPHHETAPPPFSPPYEGAQYYSFCSIQEAKEYVAHLNNKNDAYVCIPLAFLHRIRDDPRRSQTYGYIISH